MAQEGGILAGLRRAAMRADSYAALRDAFAALPEAAALVEPGGQLRLANPAMQRLCSPTPIPPVGDPVAAIFAPADRQAFAGMLASTAGGATPPTTMLRLAGAGPVEQVRALLIPLSEGALLRLEAPPPPAPAESAASGTERLLALGELAGGIAHDFNNLLTVVMGSVAAAREGANREAELRHIEAAARRGAALVAQLLAFARRQYREPRVIALNDAVRNMAELLGRVMGRRIELVVTLDEPGRCVRIDPAQLDQVIMNLGINSRDAMQEGGRLTLTTAHATVLRTEMVAGTPIPPGRWVTLEIADTGKGIPPELLPRIFEPFFTTKRDHGGTGLGLASVLGIVRQSDGILTVQSEVGTGTRMTLWLPRHPGPPDAELAAAPSRPTLVPDSPAGPILLVEDEALLRRIALRALTRAGHDVRGAEDAAQALAMIGEGLRPGLLVSDVSMPGMDGLALVRAARAVLPGLPALLVSGYAEATLNADLPAESIGFLAKPYAPGELVAAVAAIRNR
jgi:two-component system cell cycle sensor histidine kinase/response regulator CckA